MTVATTNRTATSSNTSTPVITVTEVSLDSSYPTGGETVTPTTLGLNRVDFAISTLKTTATTTVNIANAHYDKGTQKLLLFDETPAEVANAADVSGAVVQIVAFGR